MFLLNKYVENFEKYICIMTFSVMLFLTFANVLSRFIFHFSLSFSEEIVTSLFVLASLSGTSLAIRNNSHLGLDYIVSFMPQAVRKLLSIFANILGIIMCGIILYFGSEMVIHEFQSNQLSATMQWPEWIYGLSVPLGAFLLIFRYFYAIFIIITNPKPDTLAGGK